MLINLFKYLFTNLFINERTDRSFTARAAFCPGIAPASGNQSGDVLTSCCQRKSGDSFCGKARATRYVLLRPYRGIRRILVWRVDDAGKAHKFADIRLCWPQGSCLVYGGKGDEQWFDGLPWYLTDLRPQGFLGRAWGRNLAGQLNLTEDIRLWQEEDVLYALTVFNGEYTGGWLVGEGNYQRWITAQRPAAVPLDQKLTRYSTVGKRCSGWRNCGFFLRAASSRDLTCYAQTPSGNKHVLVKFTVPQQTAVSQRWGDLLIAESIAAQILCDGGIHAIESTVLVTSNRQVFLEAERFDCKGNDGRLLCRWKERFQTEFISSPGSWPEAMRHLCEQQFVTHQSVAQTEVIWAFLGDLSPTAICTQAIYHFIYLNHHLR